MSGKYIPPSKRTGKQVESGANLKIPSQDDFPALGLAKPKTAFKPVRSFALLASEWQEHEEDESVRKEANDAINRREAKRREADNQSVFIYRQQDYNPDNCDDTHDGYESKVTSADDWTTIEKKTRRELTTEELYDKKVRMEEEERRMAEDSVWNNGNEDEWDHRDRRAYS
jgi:hypothetical protein